MVAETAWIAARLAGTRDVTPVVREFELAPEAGCRSYSPGSHIRVEVSLTTGKQVRSYSLVSPSSPGGSYRIAIRRHDRSRGGSEYMWSLQLGDLMRISHPQNFFDLALDAPEYLFIAGGIGITPLLSMVRSVAAMQKPYRALYLARNREGMPYAEDLRRLCGGCLATFCASEGERADLANEISKLQEGAQAYVCGPLALMDAVRGIWSGQNRSAVDLRFETFGSGGERPAEPFTVYLADRAISVQVGVSETLLEAVRNAGVPILADCLRGECGVCILKVLDVDGQLDHQDIFLSPQQKLAQQSICACISRVSSSSQHKRAVVTVDSGYRP